ncbi:UDP-glycosyltransferase [Actinidia chinensis var. chinensis]|uniref:Glycosyltransferase n=1 Tax=Actinidia chinensis var. chinensis TaxID=1590841 RepID=A0A2R6R7W3_ACTCC|nr:UDP-glycosyltransferase [Actinidia chinensis var. chinensis]
MASQNHHHLHFVLFPLMSPGHFIPMADMAKLLAQHGVTVTIITTPLVAVRLGQTIRRSAASGLPIRLLHVPFPYAAAGLPEGSETVETIPSLDLMKNFYIAIEMLQQPFERLFEQLEPCPSCIIADKNFPWAAETARKFRVPRIIFDGMSCFTLLSTHYLFVSRVHESVSESKAFVLPGLPDTIEVTKSQLPGSFNPGSLDELDFRARVRAAEKEAYGMVVNSFEELEPRYVNGLKKVRGERVWCIGPLSLCNKGNLDKAERGNKASIDENQCLKWLDKQEPGSVVYACLGSLSRLTPVQLVELGFGLELSKRPFVWVIKGRDKVDEIDKWIEDDGFEERTKERGLIIRGWAPQVLILSHPAVGAFLTHCGWNSTLEGVCAGVPMITWPMFAEQFFNEKLIVQVLGTGVGVGAQAVVHLHEEDKFGLLVKRETVMKAVDIVMNEGMEGEERRKRARELGDMAMRAIEERGSSYLNVTLLIQDVLQQVNDKGPKEDCNGS